MYVAGNFEGNVLPILFFFFAQPVTPQPLAEEFVVVFETLSAGNPRELRKPDVLQETPWSLDELPIAIQRLKTKRGADEAGLAAELLKHAPEELVHVLFGLFNDILRTGKAPTD